MLTQRKSVNNRVDYTTKGYVDELMINIVESGAGAHNAGYRGKDLGSAVTDAQWAAIKDGTFQDLYIGDFWTIGDVTYRIAAFDYSVHIRENVWSFS